MAVQGTNFRERQRRLVRAFGSATDPARERVIRIAFNRLTDHIRASKDL